ncbi:MAG: PqiC family protein [Candidatus Entotheonellia bacterium]
MRQFLTIVILGTVLQAVIGCASTQPSRFYVLTDLSDHVAPPQAATAGQGPAVGVGPITFPKYLDRPQIGSRASRYELTFAEFQRWAEPLDTNFSRALVEHLAQLIPTDRMAVFPWPRGMAIDYQVTAEVVHFFGQIGGTSSLIANWSIFRKEGGEALVSRTSRLSAAASGPQYEAMVAAMSQTVAELSGEIATAMRTVAAAHASGR